jgi:very-short-patch-repair endonuclease
MPDRSHRSKRQTLRAQELRRTVSSSERRLWPYLRASQAGAPFRRQHPVGPFFVDYYCVPLKLAVEVDGPWHDAEGDARRDAYLSGLGITVLRFGVDEVREQAEAVVARIQEEVWILQNQRGPAR